MVVNVPMVLVSFITVFLLLTTSSTDARQSDRRRKDKSTSVVSSHPYKTNICEINDRDSKVHCYCMETHAYQNVSKAECWIFNGGLAVDEFIWAAFSSQSNLIELEFSVRADGGLNFIPERALRPLRFLRKFTIKYANIDEVMPYSFANLTSLREINMAKNKIFELKEYSIASLPNLTVITLDDNRLSELRRDSFYELPSLQKLYITNNNISVIHDSAFKHLTQLQELELEQNYIATLTRESFQGLANLKRLDLRDNKINMLGELVFAELWNLQELLLDKNILQFIAERAFDGLSQLKRLSLCENQLSTLSSGLFEGVRGLNSLDLQKNHLDTMTFDTIRPVIDNMKNYTSYLNLEGNSFDCDCRLSWMYMLKNDTKSDKVRTSLEQVTCHLELEFGEHDLMPILKSSKHKYPSRTDNDVRMRKHGHRHVEENYETFDQRDEDSYSETEQDISGDIKTSTNSNVIHLFQLTMDKLPCPSELMDSTDAPLSPLSQGEVRDYRNTGQARQYSKKIAILLALIAVWMH